MNIFIYITLLTGIIVENHKTTKTINFMTVSAPISIYIRNSDSDKIAKETKGGEGVSARVEGRGQGFIVSFHAVVFFI